MYTISNLNMKHDIQNTLAEYDAGEISREDAFLQIKGIFGQAIGGESPNEQHWNIAESWAAAIMAGNLAPQSVATRA